MKKILLILAITFLFTILIGCTKNDHEDTLNNSEHTNEGNENSEEIQSDHDNEEATPLDEDNLIDENDTPEENENDIAELIDITNDDSVTVLVNKQHSLSENYEPTDLVTVEVPTILENPEVNQLRKVAADALKEMFEQAKKDGIYLYARSGYRSYHTQVYLFDSYAKRNGEEAANKYSAKPGYSEHQTGLTMDVTSESVNFQLTEAFGETKEGKWIAEHAHEYGFILRYPKDKEHITGYIYEPWHLRYLGVELATDIKETGLTYEEYLVEKGIIHEVNSQ